MNVEDANIPEEFISHALDGADDQENSTGGGGYFDSDSDDDGSEHQDQEMEDL